MVIRGSKVCPQKGQKGGEKQGVAPPDHLLEEALEGLHGLNANRAIRRHSVVGDLLRHGVISSMGLFHHLPGGFLPSPEENIIISL